jgi:hypothetical protein
MYKLTTKYQLMLLASWVFAIYFQTQFAEISFVDDFGALSATLTQEHFSWRDTFIPRAVGAGYYRPLITISYWLDKQLWFLAPRNMHFESVLWHLCNSILLFFGARKALQNYLHKQESWLPLAVSLMFSVHPIVTESVNWISGRTDIMMSTFILISLLCVLHYQSNKSRLFLVTALLSSAIALLAKEAALGYIIGLPFLLLEQEPDPVLDDSKRSAASFEMVPFLLAFAIAVIVVLYTDIRWMTLVVVCCYFAYLLSKDILQKRSQQKSVIMRLTILVLMLFGSILSFVMIRKIVFTSNVGKIAQTVNLMFADMNYTITLFVGAIGFYARKFFLPLPLNFYIHEIDPLYDLLGIMVLLLIVFLLTISEIPATLALLGFLLLVPALPFTFGTIAWTGYAERYIYLSSALWILAIGLWISRWLDKRPQYNKYTMLVVAVLCAFAGYNTIIRNDIWKTNVSLMKDTVAQSPNKRVLHDIYIKALVSAGMITEAEHQYQYASTIAPAGRNDQSDLSIGMQLVKQKRYKDALQLYQDAIQRTKFSSEKLLSASIELSMLMQQLPNISQAEKEHLTRIEFEYREKRSVVTNNPVLLIEEGKKAIQSGSYRETTLLINKALNNVPKGNVKLIQQIDSLKRELGEQH